jgi:hypothetical protein
MTLVEKAHGDRNFRQREIRLNQHLLGALDSRFLSSGSQKFFSSAGVRIRGALLSIGSRPYFFADLCQELDTASIPGGGVAPSATEQTCSTCPTIVPSELAERSESPITAPVVDDGS